MNIMTVLGNVLAPMSLLWMNIGLAAGIIIGALPGLTGTMGIALLLPLTYGMSSIHGMMLLLGVYCGGIYGGSITAILINTPLLLRQRAWTGIRWRSRDMPNALCMMRLQLR